jgi:chorismate synthase
MSSNSFGNLFRITSFGESHGPGIGVVIDGCPAGLTIDLDYIQQQLNRRRPGQSTISSPRNESDQLDLLSGVFNGKSTGSPIAFFVKNRDQNPGDYQENRTHYRPGHADLTYDLKYGFRDYRGGGRSSARETLARVIGGAVAQMLLRNEGIECMAWVSQVGSIKLPSDFIPNNSKEIDGNEVRCPEPATAAQMKLLIEQLRDEGNTIGGTISASVIGVKPGLGEPIYHKLQADLAAAMLSINAAKGFDYGSGFSDLEKTGKELNDSILPGNQFSSNHAGGIQGGISNGQPILFRVAFKPVSTIKIEQDTINTEGEAITFTATGRHDPCVLPRAVPIVQAMCALVLADHLLLSRASAPLK